MENTNKMNRLIADLAAYQRHMKEVRQEDPVSENELDITAEEEDEETAHEILRHAADMLIDGAAKIMRAAFLMTCMGAGDDDDEEDDEEAEDACDACPYGEMCGSEYGPTVLVARPGGDSKILTIDELEDEISDDEMNDIFANGIRTCDMKPVPGVEGLYYSIPEKQPLQRGREVFYKAPAVILAVDDNKYEVVNLNAKQIYTAMRYFENATRTIKTREGGETAVFCFD
ncbi:MAG: hypothetical protein IJT43_07710 [Stomatobaculum sp.]|nr:hypothetical protein [Stomatobaculum sp.]